MAEQAVDLPGTLTEEQLKDLRRESRRENLGRAWYKFSRNPLSTVGGATIVIILLLAIFAPYIVPYPDHATKPFTDFANASQPPSREHIFGTDEIGRDVFSRTIYGFRFSISMGLIVLTLVVPVGVVLGLVAGYYQGSRTDTFIMRITDIFLAVPPFDPGPGYRFRAGAQPDPLDDRHIAYVVALVYTTGLWFSQCPAKRVLR